MHPGLLCMCVNKKCTAVSVTPVGTALGSTIFTGKRNGRPFKIVG